MRTRIHIEDRVAILREYWEKIEKLMSDLEDIIDTEFAPYDSRNYEGVHNPDVEAREYDDKDTPLMRKLLKMLEDVKEVLRVRMDEIDEEEDAYYEGVEMFRAWELGLCPYVMRKLRYEEERYAGGAWDSSYWGEIAGFLDGEGSKQEQTLRAVESWQEAKILKPAM